MSAQAGPFDNETQLLQLHKKVDEMRNQIDAIVSFVGSLPQTQLQKTQSPPQLGLVNIDQQFLAVEGKIDALDRKLSQAIGGVGDGEG
jgi:hypothetical protein